MKRSSGVLMHISSLFGEYSCGSFGHEAREFIDFLSDSGFKSWQVLPFCLPDSCNSPYKSVLSNLAPDAMLKLTGLNNNFVLR